MHRARQSACYGSGTRLNVERTYMDWNATAPLREAAREAVLSALALGGNPSSVHREGRAARAVVDAGRRSVAALVHGAPEHVVFTSGATEAANLVLTPDFRIGRSPLAVSRLYAGATEHPCIRDGGRFRADQVERIPVSNDGLVDLAALEAMLEEHDHARGLPMVAIQLANNETGAIQRIGDVAAVTKAHRGLLVVDAVQAVGRLPVAIDELGADFLILSSHKIGGPQGAGALVCAGEVMMPSPLLRGGGQERGHRSGTENLAAIAGFGAAAQEAAAEAASYAETVGGRRDAIEWAIRAEAPDVIVHCEKMPRLANTSFFTLPGLRAETAQIAFDLEGIAVSAGSACSSGKVGPSHVLQAMGFDADLGALRVSIGPATGEREAAAFLAAFSTINRRRKPAGGARSDAAA